MNLPILTLANISLIVLFAILAFAVLTDIYTQKIYNFSILFGGVIMSLYITATFGIFTLMSHIICCIIVFFFFLLPFMYKAIGGGDIKLMMLITLYFGYPESVSALLTIFICGGIFAYVFLLLKKIIHNTHIVKSSTLNIWLAETSGIPYSIPIFIGTFIFV